MVDETNVENTMTAEDERNRTPETWDELKGSMPVLGNLPDMVQPHEFTVAQSGVFAITVTRVNDIMGSLKRMGWFDKNPPASLKRKQTDVIRLVSEANVTCDTLFSMLARDAGVYSEWTKGRETFTMFFAYVTVLRWMEGELGKSDSSKTRRNNAASK